MDPVTGAGVLRRRAPVAGALVGRGRSACPAGGVGRWGRPSSRGATAPLGARGVVRPAALGQGRAGTRPEPRPRRTTDVTPTGLDGRPGIRIRTRPRNRLCR